MTNIAVNGMPGYPGAPGVINTLTGGEYVHGIQNQGGTWTDVAVPLTNLIGELMLVWFNSLPTTLPGSAGVLWNNGGTLSQS